MLHALRKQSRALPDTDPRPVLQTFISGSHQDSGTDPVFRTVPESLGQLVTLGIKADD